MSKFSLQKVSDFLFSNTRLKFLFKYLLPIFCAFLFWCVFSILFLLGIDEKDCDVTNGFITKIENVEYYTEGRRGRDHLHQEKRIEIDNSKNFVFEKNDFEEYEWVKNEFGLYVQSLNKGDRISVYTYDGPSYIISAASSNIFKIINGKTIVYPESAYYSKKKEGLKLLSILLVVLLFVYYLFVVNPWIKSRK